MQTEQILTIVARAAIAGMFGLTVVGGAVLGFTFDWGSVVKLSIGLAGMAAIAAFYTLVRPRPGIAAAFVALMDIALFTATGALFSYVVAAAGGPLWDNRLTAFDAALGLDWSAYLALANAYPVLAYVGSIAYDSIQPQIVLVITALGFGNHILRLRGFVAAVTLSCFITVILSGLMPAVDALVHLQPPKEAYANLQPSAGFVHLPHIEGLRDGSFRVLSLEGLEGIITFPSFHTTLGILFTWALWPVRWARWPALALNATLIAATPIDGGHYFADLIGGGVIAFLSIAVVNAITSRASERANVGTAAQPAE